MNLKDLYTKILYLSYFFFMWSVGFTAYSNSSVMESVTGTKSIGIIYGISALLSLVFSTWVIPQTIKYLGNRKTVGLALMWQLLAIIGIRFVDDPYLFAISFIVFLMAQILISFNFDVFFEHNTLKDSSGRARGAVVSLQHIGRMLGPIMGASIAISYGIRIPYNASFILLAIAGILLFFATKNFKDKNYPPVSFFRSLKMLKERPGVRKPLVSMILLQTFYAFMVAFVPIYLSDVQGIDIESLGLVFTIMLLPFVLFAYPIGKHLDTGASARRASRYALFVMALATIAFPIVNTKILLVWGTLLFMSRIGAVILETSSEGTFMRSIEEEETELLGLMRDMQPLGYFIASLLGSITLLFGNIGDIFYVVGGLLIIGIIITHKKKTYAHQ